MRRVITGTLLGLLLAGILPAQIMAQQQNVAIVYRLLLDKRLAVTQESGGMTEGAMGDLLHHGDQLQTSSNTRAAIRFTDDGSVLRMNPSTELSIRAEGERNALRKTLRVEFGELWARIQKRENVEYRIETPTAVAAVKGTEFYVRVEEDGRTTIVTIEGVLDFFNDVGTVEIPAGYTGVAVQASEAPTVGTTKPEDIASFTDLASEEAGPAEVEDMVEIAIQFIDENGNQKTMIIRLPRDQAQQFLPPEQN